MEVFIKFVNHLKQSITLKSHIKAYKTSLNLEYEIKHENGLF